MMWCYCYCGCIAVHVSTGLLFHCILFSHLTTLPTTNSTTTYAFCLSMLFFEYTRKTKKKHFTHGFYIYSKQTNDSQLFFLSYILLHLCLCLCLCSIINNLQINCQLFSCISWICRHLRCRNACFNLLFILLIVGQFVKKIETQHH